MPTRIYPSGETMVLESNALRVVCVPTLGGKIRSFYSMRTKTEYFYQDLRQGLGNSSYSGHDISGLDECFPTVLPCTYPDEPWCGMAMGDHGLLWNRCWDAELTESQLVSRLKLDSIPLEFTRTAELTNPGSLLLRYAIENQGAAAFEYLHAAHLMLRAEPTTRVVYPPEMRRAYIAVAVDNPVLNEGTWADWPPSEVSLVKEPLLPQHGTLVKLFSPALSQGSAGVAHGDLPEQLTIEFSVDQLPYLGVLLAPGFGPLGKDAASTLLAIEPTSSMADDLPMARKTHSSRSIPAGKTIQFWLRLSLHQLPNRARTT